MISLPTPEIIDGWPSNRKEREEQKRLENELKTDDMQLLFAAFMKPVTNLESKRFLRDLCTLPELRALATRLRVATLIMEKRPYLEIRKKTGASTATITRVAHWIHHGTGGYRLVLGHWGYR